MGKMFLVFAVLGSLAIVNPVRADMAEISQKAVLILNQEHPADLKELVHLKKPALAALSKVGMQQRLLRKEEAKSTPDPKTLNAQKVRLTQYLKESKKWEPPYLNKLEVVAKAILAKITKSRALQGEKLDEAKMVVEMAVDHEVEIRATEQMELAGIKNLPQKVVGLLKQEHPSELNELVGIKLSALNALDKLEGVKERKTGEEDLKDQMLRAQRNLGGNPKNPGSL